MWSHETGGLVVYLFCALYGEMYLVASEAAVDVIDGLHESFLAGLVFRLVGGEQVQLHSVGSLQLAQDDTGLFVLVVLAEEFVQQLLRGVDDLRGVIGGCGQFDSLVGIVLSEVEPMAVGSEEDRDGAAERALFAQFA